MSTSPNPQGKGTNETLGFLALRQEQAFLPDVHDDSLERIVGDYLSSLFVLSCTFKFRPVPDKPYYIYSHKGKLLLSLIGPDEGGRDIFNAYLGQCQLNGDLSWTVQGAKESAFTVHLESDEASTEQDRVRTILRAIGKVRQWTFDGGRGYYQNAMSYLLLKALRFRCERLKHSGLALSEEKRLLLESFPDTSSNQ